jgi:CelD/BcsL family acetyltransferase involved in cellulose biosynthesis
MNYKEYVVMTYAVSQEKLENLRRYYLSEANNLRWPFVFMLPGWLDAWWQVFGAGFESQVLIVREDNEVIGIAPLKLKDGIASFIGDNSVCDYLDFIVTPGKEEIFSQALMDYLPGLGVRFLILETLRPESMAGHNVVDEAKRCGKSVSCSRIEVSYEMDLPATWEKYLGSLESKQRRDVERKIRQLDTLAEVRFSIFRDSEVQKAEIATFFQMMADSRRDKSEFLTAEMRSFFEKIGAAMSAYGLLRLAFLEVGLARVAAILYFEYNDRIYLYNSGYMPQFAEMNVGLVSKLYCIRQAIEERRKVFDYLKGPEVYKSRLGGREVGLSRCVIDLQ